jgi:large subunit ribosomal protein L18
MRKSIGKLGSAKEEKRYRRKLRIRTKVTGSADRPRVCIVRSSKNLLVQVCDDNTSSTIFSLSTFGKNKPTGAGRNKDGAKILGAAVGEKLKEKKLKTVVFDRNGHRYHGVIAALADGIREAGIKF